jgi:hypothetical protein
VQTAPIVENNVNARNVVVNVHVIVANRDSRAFALNVPKRLSRRLHSHVKVVCVQALSVCLEK